MKNQKLENLLNLACATPEELEKSPELVSGIMKWMNRGLNY